MDENLRTHLPDPDQATRFWWIRHAPVPEAGRLMYGSLDLDCVVTDTALFEGIAARLPKNAHWVSSPLKRTRQTADALFKAGAVAASEAVDPDIAEMDFGSLNGQTLISHFEQREDAFKGYWPLDPNNQAPDGESFEMLVNRVENFVSRMQQERLGQNIICVAHRGTILAALQLALQQPLRTSVAFEIDNVSLTRITHHADAPNDGLLYRLSEVGWTP